MAKKCLSCVKTLASQSQAETDSLCKFGNPDNAACIVRGGGNFRRNVHSEVKHSQAHV